PTPSPTRRSSDLEEFLDNTACQTKVYHFRNTPGLVSSSATNLGVDHINMTNGGSGYATAPTVTFTGGAGTGAAGTAIGNGTGVVAAVNMTAGGTGYT